MPNPSATEVERIVALESGMIDVRRDVHEIRTDVAVMRDSLAKRPSWAVCTLITLLSTACGVLASTLAVVLSTQ